MNIRPTAGFARMILIGLIGNVMEWYDFAVYGFFATVIGKLFFPADNPAISLVASFGAFAAGFLVRPLGGLLFGRIGDRMGRQRAMLVSILSMAVPTVMMGFLPTYATAGFLAPILIVTLRMVQGLSVGGEFTSSLVYLAEQAPPQRRALLAIWGNWGASAGILVGSGVGWAVNAILDDGQILAWGWRVPFWLGGLVALAGWWIRHGLHNELPLYATESPVRAVFTTYRRDVLRVALLNIGSGVAFYTAFVYAVSYIRRIDHLSESLALEVNTKAMLLLLVMLPLSAWLSDRFGRRPLLLGAYGGLFVGAVPLFHLIHSHHEPLILLGEFGFAVILGLMTGGIVAANVELMPRAIRCTGLAFAYNASIGLFGGVTPMVAAWLIMVTANPVAPAYWVMGAAAISLLTLILSVPETRHLEI